MSGIRKAYVAAHRVHSEESGLQLVFPGIESENENAPSASARTLAVF